MKVVFMGSSAASATCLQAILRLPELQVVGVVTQPDRPVGRGRALTPCPCKAYALKRGITAIISPENVNDDEPMAQLRAWAPDVVAVVAYGQFLKAPLLDLPPLGCINCHFSILPKYRGASPVIAALAAGESVTGVSVIRMGLGMDDGPILDYAHEPIYSDDTGGSLMDGLAITGGVHLAKTLSRLAHGEKLNGVPQDSHDATFAHKLRKTDGFVNWDEDVIVIERKIRAYSPWPGMYTFLPERFRRKGNSGRVVILRAEFAKVDACMKCAFPGTVVAIQKRGPVVKCGNTALLLTEIKPEGSGVMNGAAFLNGRKLVIGDVLG